MMKKLISYALTLSMLVCMATTAFAVKDQVVGDNDGWSPEEWTANADTSYNVDIKVTTGGINHRYAVDLEYEEVVMSISGGSLTWNVNTLKYDVVGSDAGLADTPFSVSVTNRSDNPVYVSAKIENDLDDGINVSTTKTVTSEGENGQQVESQEAFDLSTPVAVESAAPTGTNVEGEAKILNFNLYVSSADWDAVAEHYGPKLSADEEITVATCTITIAKEA